MIPHLYGSQNTLSHKKRMYSIYKLSFHLIMKALLLHYIDCHTAV